MKCACWKCLYVGVLFANFFLSHALAYDYNATARRRSYRVEVYAEKDDECGGGATKCLRKCCKERYVLKNDTCLYRNAALKVPVYRDGDVVETALTDVTFVTGMIECRPDERIDNIKITRDIFQKYSVIIENDGSVYMPFITWQFDPNEYCIEYSEKLELLAFLCYDKYPDDINFGDRLSFLGMIVSLPFLLATFVVYCLLPTRNMHGKCLMCYVSALFLANFWHVFSALNRTPMSFLACRLMGMFAYFCVMASVFWMSAMSFDICKTFAGTKVLTRKKKNCKQFLIYSVYAWGIPLSLVIVIILLSSVAKTNAWYDPGFRGQEFFLRDGIPEAIFYYGPISLVTTANVVMFYITRSKIRKVQAETAMIMRHGSQKHSDNDNRQIYHLYIKLLFAMGLNWSVEIINWAINWFVEGIPHEIWYVTDFVNAAYGMFIFFIFVCKKSIWQGLKARCGSEARNDYTITNTDSKNNSLRK